MFEITKQYWNDSGDYRAYWSTERDESIIVDNTLEKVRAYVEAKNKIYIDAALKPKVQELANLNLSLAQAEKRVAAVSQLDVEGRSALGVSLVDAETNVKHFSNKIKQVEKEIMEINTDPFHSTGWHVPVRERYDFHKVEIYTIIEDNGQFSTVMEDDE